MAKLYNIVGFQARPGVAREQLSCPDRQLCVHGVVAMICMKLASENSYRLAICCFILVILMYIGLISTNTACLSTTSCIIRPRRQVDVLGGVNILADVGKSSVLNFDSFVFTLDKDRVSGMLVLDMLLVERGYLLP